MANQEQLEILKSGVNEWNAWREKNLNIGIDLSDANLRDLDLRFAYLGGANLSNADLSGANLSRMDLSETDLSGVDLRDANLRVADLSGSNLRNANLWRSYLSRTDLSDVDLSGANLSRANLNDADLSYANLRDVNLAYADLRGANLKSVNLNNAKLQKVILGSTVFAFQDLNLCNDLESVIVYSECIIDYKTLTTSKKLPKSFLKKIGLPDIFINYIPEFRDPSPIRLFPVFLSHSWANKNFAGKLYETLIDKNVQVWYDEKQMRPGDDILDGITRGINLYDKTLLVCSKDSLDSWWVNREMNKLFEKERELQKQGKNHKLLIPIKIDNYIEEWNGGAASIIKEKVIGDFNNWQDPKNFNEKVEELLQALNVERTGDIPISYL